MTQLRENSGTGKCRSHGNGGGKGRNKGGRFSVDGYCMCVQYCQ